MIKVTIDLNIILDFLNKRENHVQAAKIFDLCSKNIVDGYVCAHEITTLAYFLTKSHNDSSKVKYVLGELFDLFHIIPVKKDILKEALNSKINDYEDAVIEISSLKNDINYIITRNLSDFKNSTVKSLSPSEFLTLQSLQ